MNRFERKFIFENGNLDLISNVLKANGYIEEFPKRKLTSIYYDTKDFSLYKLSVNGVSERKKIRVRFYDNEFSKAKIEYKYKSGEMGWKNFQQIENKNFNLIQLNYISEKSNKENNLFIPLFIDSIYQPNLIVVYKRRYFKSKLNKNRITLDTDLSFGRLYKSKFLNFFENNFKKSSSVLELKYDEDINPDFEIINILSKYIGLIYSRFSKYCEGIEHCY